MTNDSKSEREITPALSKKLLSVQEAAETLSVSKWTLYQLLRSEQIKSFTIGKRRLIPATEIDTFVERTSAGASY